MTGPWRPPIIAAVRPLSPSRAALALGLALLLAGLTGCAGEPARVAAPPPSTPVERTKPKAPGTPTLGDVIDQVQSRRKVIEQLEEIQKDEP